MLHTTGDGRFGIDMYFGVLDQGAAGEWPSAAKLCIPVQWSGGRLRLMI